MTERFTVDDGLEDVLCWEINDKENENMTCGECAKLLNELHEENQTLLRKNGAMEEEIECLSEENEQLRTKNNAYIQDIEVFKEENTHLKLENEELKDFAQHNYSETKKIINNLQKEKEHIKHTIKTMMENERTELGQSVLKQLWEQIE